MQNNYPLRTGDTITLNANAREWTRGKFFIVSEVRSWGCVCYMPVSVEQAFLFDAGAAEFVTSIEPQSEPRAYYRASWEQIEGVAVTVSPAK